MRVQRGHHRDELLDGEVLDEPAGLQHGTDRPSRDGALRRPPEEPDRTAVRPGQPEQHVDRRRLAGAVRAEDRHHLARCDLQVDAGDGLDRAVALVQAGEVDRHAADFVLERALLSCHAFSVVAATAGP